MAVVVNVAQYNSVPDVQASSGSSTGAIAQFPGPLIVAANVTVNPSAAVAWESSALYAMVTIVDDIGKVYADSAAADSPALAVGEGQLIREGVAVIRRGTQAYLLLREHA